MRLLASVRPSVWVGGGGPERKVPSRWRCYCVIVNCVKTLSAEVQDCGTLKNIFIHRIIK